MAAKPDRSPGKFHRFEAANGKNHQNGPRISADLFGDLQRNVRAAVVAVRFRNISIHPRKILKIIFFQQADADRPNSHGWRQRPAGLAGDKIIGRCGPGSKHVFGQIGQNRAKMAGIARRGDHDRSARTGNRGDS